MPITDANYIPFDLSKYHLTLISVKSLSESYILQLKSDVMVWDILSVSYILHVVPGGIALDISSVPYMWHVVSGGRPVDILSLFYMLKSVLVDMLVGIPSVWWWIFHHYLDRSQVV